MDINGAYGGARGCSCDGVFLTLRGLVSGWLSATATATTLSSDSLALWSHTWHLINHPHPGHLQPLDAFQGGHNCKTTPLIFPWGRYRWTKSNRLRKGTPSYPLSHTHTYTKINFVNLFSELLKDIRQFFFFSLLFR